MQQLLIPRRLNYQKSSFYLDFFQVTSWNMTSDIPRERIKAALVVKNTSDRPMSDIDPLAIGETTDGSRNLADLPRDYYFTSLQSFVPKSIIIAFQAQFEATHEINFAFIKKSNDRLAPGLKISDELDLEDE